MTFSSTVRCASRLNVWKTKPISSAAQGRALGARRGRRRRCPSSRYVPLVGRSRQPRTFSSVDLPEPDGPTIATDVAARRRSGRRRAAPARGGSVPYVARDVAATRRPARRRRGGRGPGGGLGRGAGAGSAVMARRRARAPGRASRRRRGRPAAGRRASGAPRRGPRPRGPGRRARGRCGPRAGPGRATVPSPPIESALTGTASTAPFVLLTAIVSFTEAPTSDGRFEVGTTAR